MKIRVHNNNFPLILRDDIVSALDHDHREAVNQFFFRLALENVATFATIYR